MVRLRSAAQQRSPVAPATGIGRPNRTGINWRDTAQVNAWKRDWNRHHLAQRRAYGRRYWRTKRAALLRAYDEYIAQQTGLHREKVRQVLEAYEEAKKELA